MLNTIKETIINTIKETMSNREALIYLVIGIVIAYYLFNLVSSILKYPIIIVLGFLLGNLIKKNSFVKNE
tara:strand:+ start:332 stop:541 length:210 start_codon:yes stop_codon:yes gene_type:complete